MNAVYGKTMENLRKHNVYNLSQQKEDTIIQYQNQIIILLYFSQKIYLKKQKGKH